MGLPSPFVLYALVDIVIRFFDTDQSLLIRFSMIEIKGRKSLPRLAYVIRAKHQELLKINGIIILLKRDKIKPYSERSPQRINAG